MPPAPDLRVLVQVRHQPRGVELAHIGKFVGKERLLVKPVDQWLGVQRQQLDHARQLVAAPHIAEAAFDRAHGVGPHAADADDHRGVDSGFVVPL